MAGLSDLFTRHADSSIVQHPILRCGPRPLSLLHTILGRLHLPPSLLPPFCISLALCFVMLSRRSCSPPGGAPGDEGHRLSVGVKSLRPFPLVPRADPAYRRHHCLDYGLRPLSRWIKNSSPCARRLQPVAALPPVFLFAALVCGLTLMMATVRAAVEQCQPEKGGAEPVARRTGVGSSTAACSAEAIPKDGDHLRTGCAGGQDNRGIFVADRRNPADPRIIVAQQYQ